MTIGTEKSRKMTVPERPRGESSPTAFKAAAEKRELTHCIQGSGREERAHPLHSRQWWKTRGLSYPHKGKRGNEAKVLMTKDRKGSGAQYPQSATGSVEDYKELWCDVKRQFEYR